MTYRLLILDLTRIYPSSVNIYTQISTLSLTARFFMYDELWPFVLATGWVSSSSTSSPSASASGSFLTSTSISESSCMEASLSELPPNGEREVARAGPSSSPGGDMEDS